MAKGKSLGLKKKLAKFNRQTRYAPFWAVIKKFGRLVHPIRITIRKRHWRRNKIRDVL